MEVMFPGLGIGTDNPIVVNQTAFTIAGWPVQWYGIIIAFGFALAVIYAMTNAKKFKINTDNLIDAAIIGVVAGIIGARLYYIVFSTGAIREHFIQNPISMLYIWEGGLGIYGGIIFGIGAGAIVCKVKKMNISATLDIAGLGFLIGQGIGRWGNFINQEAFGRKTNFPWGMVSANTGGVPVHPCFFYESVWCLLGFVLLHIFSKKFRRYDGQVFLLYIAWYGAGRFVIESLRTDSLMLFGLKVSQIVAVLMIIVSVAIMIKNRKTVSVAGIGYKRPWSVVSEEIKEEKKQEELDKIEQAKLNEKKSSDESLSGDDNVSEEIDNILIEEDGE